jgi:calcineurin-like phosphoesterase
MNEVDRLVLPANMANVDHFRMGFKLLQSKNGVPFAVINLIGKAFMYGENRNPFSTFDQIMKEIPPRYKIIVVDMHAEATSEKQGIGRYATGKASLVYGTHSHVQTADERIIDSKTGFITDIGMTGPYESIIGIRIDAALNRMLTGEKTKFEPATNDPWFCAIVVDIDEESGHCNRIERLRWDSLKASSTC